MLPIWLKFFSVAATLGIAGTVFFLAGKPMTHHRTIETIASTMLVMGIPLVGALVVMAAHGKWEGFIFLCVITNVFFVAACLGYIVADRFNLERFQTTIGAGMASLILFGGPLAAAILP